MNNKVMLINPPYPFEESPSPPFGLMSLAAYLEEKGFEVIIEDYVVNPYSDERVRKTIERFRPSFVGATAVTMNVNRALSILGECRNADPGLVILLGGPHATFDPGSILESNPHIDYIVRREGEITTAELLASLIKGNDIESIKGISFRKNGTAIHAPDRPFIEDINILPYPARHLVELGKYRAIGLPVNMVTSRGCPFECVFCVGSKMVGRRVRYFAVDRVVDEFEMLSKKGFRQINIVDDLFTSNRERCISVCIEIIERGIDHPWTAFARVDTVSPDLLSWMKRAGCTTLCFGIESGNQGILNRVKKKINLDGIKKAVDMCNGAGIVPMTSYILGLPGETPETVRETLELARRLSPSYGYHILAPFPGTEVREKKEEFGIRILSDDWDRYDANQSVSESVTMPGSEVDRIVGEFNGSIQNYVRSAVEKFDRNEPLSGADLEMVRSLKSALFATDIISRELVENYPGMEEGRAGSIREDFTGFVRESAGYEAGYASSQVDRLFDLECIRTVCGGGNCTLSWS
ncbi:MAG: B12-binding domain-containing radical SAM protein [Spirochaetes bacterium]|jgi:radical SAM superfamily enzyme YgiQ (UPF0313 family)|nr:B12-binding domain-containing radical SAM protein [Spirochaetota bacterium]